MKVLICGDSFAADWTVKYPGKGWPNLIAENYTVTNLAQAGCSEYKIYLQLESVNLNEYDAIIVSHTSPNRLPVDVHPVHSNDPLHKNSDLIYTDLKGHVDTHPKLQPIIEYYEHYFNFEYAVFTHTLICEKIKTRLSEFEGKTLHIANLNWDNLYQFENMLHFEYLFKTNRGLMNHFDDTGNFIVFDKVNKFLTS